VIRWLLRAALVILLVVVVLLAALPWLAGPALRAGLDAADLDAVAFEEVKVGLRGAEVIGLAIGRPPVHRIAHLRATYAPSGLIAGRIERVSIDGLEARARLTAGGLEVAGPGTGGAVEPGAPPPLPRIEQVELRDASIILDTPAGELHLPLRAEIEPSDGHARFALSIDRARLAGLDGELGLDLAFEGGFPIEPGLGLDDLAGRGRLAIETPGLAIDDLGRGISAAGVLALDLEDGRLRAESEALELEIGALAPHLAALGEALPPPWRLHLGTAAGPALVEIARQADGAVVDVAVPVALETARPTLNGRLSGTLTLDRDHRPKAVRTAKLRLDVGGLRWRGLDVADGRIDATAAGTWPALRGSLRIDAQSDASLGPDVTVNGITVAQGFDYAADASGFRLMPQANGTLRLARVALSDRIEGGPFVPELQGSDEPALRVDFVRDVGLRWRQRLAARIPAFEARWTGAGRTVPLSGEAGRLELELTGDAGGVDEGRAGLAEGKLRLPQQAIRLEGLRAELALGAAGPRGELPIEVAEIRHAAEPAWFRPLAASLRLEPGARPIPFSGRLTGAGGALVIEASGVHDAARGVGEAEIELAPLGFDPGGLQPAQISPLIGGLAEAVAGRVSADGVVFWTPAELAGQATALLEDLSLSAGPARLERINGIIRLDQLLPPSTPPGQQLAIGEVDLGVPLTNGLVAFDLEPGPALEVERLRFDWAGGMLRAEPFTVGSAGLDFTVVLEAEALDLAAIFEQVRLGGLSGKGTISGRLPIRFEGTEAVIDGGELAAESPGWLRYRPQSPAAGLQAGGQSMELLLQALENFQYESLRITLDGRTDAKMDVGLHITGANPELYGGHPIEFNLNLEGELGNVLRSGLSGYRVPERIRERMEEFRR